MIHPKNAFPVISYFNHILFAILFPFRPCTSFLYIQQILITVSVPSSAAPGYLIREDSPDKLYHFPLARREIKIPRIIFPSLKPASVHIISHGRFYLSLSQHPVETITIGKWEKMIKLYYVLIKKFPIIPSLLIFAYILWIRFNTESITPS